MAAWKPPRRLAPLLVGAVALPLLAAAPAGALSISGADTDVWNTARPTPSYVVTGPPGSDVEWRLTGTNRDGQGPPPVRVTLADLRTGTYTLVATQAEPDETARRRVTVDVSPPGVAVRAPQANAVYEPNEPVTVDFSCSGAVSCTGT